MHVDEGWWKNDKVTRARNPSVFTQGWENFYRYQPLWKILSFTGHVVIRKVLFEYLGQIIQVLITVHLTKLQSQLSKDKSLPKKCSHIAEQRSRIFIGISGVPVMVQQKWIRLGTMRLQVWSLESLSGLRIRHCNEMWYRLQTWLGSGIAMALV